VNSVISFAPGKSILFGEHAVVYGYPAIAISLNRGSRCRISETKKNKLVIKFENYNQTFRAKNIEELGKVLPYKYKQLLKAFKIVIKRYNIQLKNLEISLSSTLFPGAGLGSSASIAASLIKALSCFYELGLRKGEINSLAYELEKIVHGTPSGIDNTICTHGNAIYFKDGKFDFIEIPPKVMFLITYTNIEHDTKEAINRIKKLRDTNPKQTQNYLKEIGHITNKARVALNNKNFPMIGKLMNLNQHYLSKLQISNEVIDNIRDISLKNGAFGSKLTGAGLGGCVITLGDEASLITIASVLKKEGFKNFIARNDKKGVRCEKK
jgi:mevalonate kinase